MSCCPVTTARELALYRTLAARRNAHGDDGRWTFRLPLDNSGIAQLDPALTINGTTVTPTFRYRLGDADATNLVPWGYGETLNVVSGGGLGFNDGAPGLGSDDDSCLFDGTGYYEDPAAVVGHPGTNDIVLELVFRMRATADQESLLGTWTLTSGWTVYSNASAGTVIFAVDDGPTFSFVQSAALDQPGWMHAIVFADRSGSAQWYINGAVNGSPAVISGSAASIDNAASFRLGRSPGQLAYTSNVAYVAMWQGAAWLDTHLQAAVAEERFRRMCGLYPKIAKGTSNPNTVTRATTAHLDIDTAGVRKLYLVGAGWLRCCSRQDSASTLVKGYLPELAATNPCLQSQTFDNATWSKTTCTITADSVAAPDGTATADTLAEDGSSATSHQVGQAIAATNTVQYCFSVWAKKTANRNWIALYQAGVTPVCYSYFNVDTGAMGGQSNLDARGIQDWGNGWYRVWIVYTATATGTGQYRLYIGEADGDFTFDGLTQDSLYLWGAQVETAAHPTSYIPTVASAVTRNKDELQYKGDDGNLGGVGSDMRGTLRARVLLPNYNTPASVAVASINDGGTTNRILTYVLSSNDTATLFVADGGASQAAISATGDISDGAMHDIATSWRQDRFTVRSDDSATLDAAGTAPTGLSTIDVGQDAGSNAQLGGLISDLRIERAKP